MALEALRKVRLNAPELVAVIAPRKPDALRETCAFLESTGTPYARRSRAAAGARTLVLDTLGEQARYYASADAAFVGGSLVPAGGHDVMEPARAGVPVIFGLYTDNCAPDARALLAGGGAIRVRDAAGLAAAMQRLLESPEDARSMGAAAGAVAQQARGAARRSLDWLLTQGALPAEPSFAPGA
jgi:3-deoxy-D-manno-octulosonic-acid transferase